MTRKHPLLMIAVLAPLGCLSVACHRNPSGSYSVDEKALQRATAAEAARARAEAEALQAKAEASQAKAEADASRKAETEAERRRERAEAALAEADRRQEEAVEKAIAETATKSAMAALKEGKTVKLPDIEYRVISSSELPRDKYQRYATALVKTANGAYIVVSGISPDDVPKGGLWKPEPGAVFTALKPEKLPSLETPVPHIAQDPTTRAGFTGKPAAAATGEPSRPALGLTGKDALAYPQLAVTGLRVGARGRPEFIDAKVRQVIDDKSMLVGIEDARTGDGRYSTWIMLKCSTAGITDGKFWRGGQWEAVTGSAVLAVTGTTTYKTAGGGTRTVFVVEPVKGDEKK